MKGSTVRRGILSLIALCALLSAGASCSAERKAPDFTLADQHGVRQSLSSLRGKVVVIYFWATYCPTCAKLFPIVEKLNADYGRRGAVVLGMNAQLSQLADKYLRERGYRLRTLHDPYGKVSRSYRVPGLPVLTLIGKNGMIARTFIGQAPEKEVRAAIDKLLKGASLAASKPKSSSGMCEMVRLDAPPVRSSGRVLVPMRGIFQWLGAKVKWNEKARSVSASSGSRSLEVAVGSRRAKVGGKSVSLDAPPQMIGGRVYVPLRFVGQALGVKIEYRPDDGGVLLTSGSKCGFVPVY